MELNDNIIKSYRKCLYLGGLEYKRKNIATPMEFAEDLLRDTMSYIFYRARQKSYLSVEDFELSFLANKRTYEKNFLENELYKRIDIKKYEKQMQSMFSKAKKLINNQELMIEQMELEDIIPSLNIELDIKKIIEVTPQVNKTIKSRQVKLSANLPVVFKQTNGKHIVYIFSYQKNCTELDPLINIAEIFFLISKIDLEQIVVFDVYNNKKLFINSSELSHIRFLEEIADTIKMIEQKIDKRHFGVFCEECYFNKTCISGKRAKINFSKNDDRRLLWRNSATTEMFKGEIKKNLRWSQTLRFRSKGEKC